MTTNLLKRSGSLLTATTLLVSIVLSPVANALPKIDAEGGGNYTKTIFQRFPKGAVKVLLQGSEIQKVLNLPSLLNDTINSAWMLAREPACQKLIKELGTPERVISGQTLYDINCSMASSGSLQIQDIEDDQIQLQYVLPGNYLEATTTQPVPLGKWANPRGAVTYDLVMKMKLSVPNLTEGIKVDEVVIEVENASKPDLHGFLGDLLTFVNGINNFFGGSDFLSQAQNSLNGTQKDLTEEVNLALKDVNKVLQNYTQ